MDSRNHSTDQNSFNGTLMTDPEIHNKTQRTASLIHLSYGQC